MTEAGACLAPPTARTAVRQRISVNAVYGRRLPWRRFRERKTRPAFDPPGRTRRGGHLPLGTLRWSLVPPPMCLTRRRSSHQTRRSRK